MKKTYKIGRSAKTGRFTVTRSAFSKITAVEGIFMSESMKEELEALDKAGLSAVQRRSHLTKKYG